MDGRDSFLTMARDQHLEFSSLRRCKYSSLAMLYELHTQAMVKRNNKKFVEKLFYLRGKINLCTTVTPAPSLLRPGTTALSVTTLICAWRATRRTDILTRWRSLASILTGAEASHQPPAILRRRGS